jgi:hypothetical protein
VDPRVDVKVKEGRLRGAGVALAGVAASLIVFGFYLSTLAPTVLYYERPLFLDTAMLQVQAAVLGMTHPTGYPTWVMLTHLFTYLPFGDVAYRTNLASAVYATLSVFVIFCCCLLISKRLLAAVVGALSFGLGTTLWSQAVIAEVYTLNALLIALTLLTLILWREKRRDRYLLLTCLLLGLCLTNHLTSGILLPTAIVFVLAVDRAKLLDWRLVVKGALLFIVGLMPYLYLPIRASMDPPLDEANPDNWERLWYLVSGGGLQATFGVGPAELPGRFLFYADHLQNNFHWGLIMAGMVGFASLLLWDRKAALLTGFPFAGWLIHALEYRIYDIQLYYIPTYLIFALWIAAGVALIQTEAEAATQGISNFRLRNVVLGLLAWVLILFPLLGVERSYLENDMSDDYRGRKIIEAVVDEAAPGSTILHHRSSLWYMLLVEHRRQDLRIIDPFYPLRVRYDDIAWPDEIDLRIANLRYGTNDITGVSTAFDVSEDGPVYILNQDSANPYNFYEAGFRTAQVKGDLFELVPPGEEPYTPNATPQGGTSLKASS